MSRLLVCVFALGVATSGQAQGLANSLFRGAWSGQTAAVRSAVTSGEVDINVTDRDGNTALIVATSRGHENVVEVLLEGAADPNLANNAGATALVLASMYAMNSIAVHLIEAGANVNAQDELGRSPWSWAAWGDNASLQSLLKKSGSDGSGETDPFHEGTPVVVFQTRPDLKKWKSPKISTKLRESGVAGTVALRVVVDRDGKVRSVELLEGVHDELDQEVLEQVRKWKLSPGEIQGKPVPGIMTVDITFAAAGKRDGYVLTGAHQLP